MHLIFWSVAIIILLIRGNYTFFHITIEVQMFCFGPPFWGKVPIKWGKVPIKWGEVPSQMRKSSSSSCFDPKIRGMRTLFIIYSKGQMIQTSSAQCHGCIGVGCCTHASSTLGLQDLQLTILIKSLRDSTIK